MEATTVQDVQSVKENGGSLLRLTLGDGSNISDLSTAIATSFHNNLPSSRLSTIVLAGGLDAYPSSSWCGALHALLNSIGKIDSIRNVRFESFGISTLTVAMLSELLCLVGNRLEALTISDMIILGRPDQIDHLVQAVKHLRCLRHCYLFFMCVRDDESHETIDISSVFEAISKLPMLVGFRADFSHVGIPAFTLERSLVSFDSLVLDKLLMLALGDIHINSPWLEALAQTIGANKSLRDLSLCFYSVSTSTESSKLQFLADALRVNTNLKCVDLKFCSNCPDLNQFWVQVVKAITQNAKSSITDLSIVSPNTKLSLFGEAAVEMLKTNYTLVAMDYEVVGDSLDCSVWGDRTAEIQMYLRLNVFGRKKLFGKHQASRKTWVDFIARLTPTNDLDCIFYCLQMNPSLCQVALPNIPLCASSHGRNKRGFSEVNQNQNDMGQHDVGGEKNSKRMKLSLEEMQRKHAMELEEMQKKHATEKAHLEEEIERLKSGK